MDQKEQGDQVEVMGGASRMAYDGKELLKSMMMAGVHKMVVPTIIQASCGGYITIIEGVGVFASSSLQEAFDFAASHAEKKFGAKAAVDMHNLPRFMQPGIWDRAKRSVGLGALVVVAAAVTIWGATGGRSNGQGSADEYSHPAATAWRKATRPEVYFSPEINEPARLERPPSVPEVDVREVRTESYGQRGQSGISTYAPRRVRPHQ